MNRKRLRSLVRVVLLIVMFAVFFTHVYHSTAASDSPVRTIVACYHLGLATLHAGLHFPYT